MPFYAGDRNDHRTGVDFLTHLTTQAKRSLSKRGEDAKGRDVWVKREDSTRTWKECIDLLVTHGNLASHGGTVTLAETKRLIETCEKALTALRCDVCDELVWTVPSGQDFECGCGDVRWKWSF